MVYLLAYIIPLLLAGSAAYAFSNPGKRPEHVPFVAEAAALAALAWAFMCAVILIVAGSGTSPLIGLAGYGFSVRFDVVSIVMILLVSFVGWIVLRYTRTYLDGEDRQGLFTAWMSAALASVMALIMAGNLLQLLLAWLSMSFCLHRLLLFYPARAAAQRAARKKAFVSSAAGLLLAVAVVVLGAHFGTGDIASILASARVGEGTMAVSAAALLLAGAAILKSAQFPANGWLTEVMEAPTPVSALLHAGVINAGGFLLIRFADVMLLAPGVLALLVMIGGFTAIAGGMAMLAQPAVKTSLAWSTIAQMGFMILQCGLALFSLALLHIVAHSLYKAHAFLASGSAVEAVTTTRRPGPIAIPSGWAVIQAFVAALVLYGVVVWAFGTEAKSSQAIALGAILVFGVAYLIAQGLADAAPRALTLRVSLYSVAATIGYFLLQSVAAWLTRGTLPATPEPDPLGWALIVLAVVSFGAVALAQALFPLWSNHPAATGLRVHLANGLYFNAVFDRVIGGWSKQKQS